MFIFQIKLHAMKCCRFENHTNLRTQVDGKRGTTHLVQ